MDQKILTIIAVVEALLIILLAFTAYSYFQKSKPVIEVEAQQNCDEIANSYTKDACNFQKALSENNVNVCSSITGANIKDMCFIEISQMQKDKSICKSVTDKYYSQPKCYAELQMMGIN